MTGARTGWAAALVAPLLAPALLLGSATPAAAAEGAECAINVLADSEGLADTTAKVSEPIRRMHVDRAHEITRGRGVTVALVDSGIQPGLGINQAPPSLRLPGLAPILLSGHGTVGAGLIAGPDGVAPEARVIDVRVLDSETPDLSQGQQGVTSGGIAAGVRQLVALHRTTPFQVANIALSVSQDDPVLRSAIRELVRRDVVVVASAGNAPADPDASFEGTPDSDAAVYPADYPGVLAVSAVAPGHGDVTGLVAPNRDTDVAAPTVGGLSVNVTGQRCRVEEVATSWAAAQVSGVVALLRSAFPRESAKQVVARLTATAEGSGTAGNPWTGAGVVQAYDALTRQLQPGRSGRIDRSVAETRSDAQAPPAPQRLDLFGSSQALLLWFGLLAGAVMALAFLLRPLLRR